MRRQVLAVVCLSLFGLVACGSESEDTSPANNANTTNNLNNLNNTNNASTNNTNNVEPQPMAWPEVAVTSDGFMADYPQLIDFNEADDVVEVYLTAGTHQAQMASDLLVETYAYNGVLPGPLLLANVGDEVIVHFKNELLEPTTVHWHGLRISDDMDGNPRIMNPVEPGEEFTYRFVVPDAGTYWYHPHMKSNEQIEKGLYGALVVREADAPEYDAERYLTIDDILLNGSQIAPFLQSHPEIMHGRSGNALITNGKMDELKFTVDQGTVERWHLVNPANARTMSLSIDGARWRVIGVDGGRVEPYQVDRLQMAVGQRFDIEVAYDEPGEVVMNSYVLSVQNNEVVEIPIQIVAATVTETGNAARTVQLPAPPVMPSGEVTREETIVFNAVNDGLGNVIWTLNNAAFNREVLFTFKKGDVVRIRLDNEVGPEHPFHLHGQFFTIVDKGTEETSQPGLKDTVLLPGLSSVEIIAYMDNPGEWMAHCHINEHAALGMMASIVVEE